jgi:predicted membrane channel-forming protein YqfA (hemolysin III family)
LHKYVESCIYKKRRFLYLSPFSRVTNDRNSSMSAAFPLVLPLFTASYYLFGIFKLFVCHCIWHCFHHSFLW